MKLRGVLLLLLFAGYVFMLFYGMPNAAKKLNAASSDDVIPIDLQLSYDTELVGKTFLIMGEEGRSMYRSIETREDIIYPLTWGLLFSLTIYHFIGKSFPRYKRLRLMAFIPIIGMLFDFLENILILNMLDIFPDLSTGLTAIASTVTSVKWIFGFASMFLIFLLLLIYIFKKIFRRIPAQEHPAEK